MAKEKQSPEQLEIIGGKPVRSGIKKLSSWSSYFKNTSDETTAVGKGLKAMI